MIQESKTDRALLTKSELEWLLGNTHVSKGYERRIRFSIRNKIQTLREFELPLLIDKGFITNNLTITAGCNGVTTDCNVKKPDSPSFLQNRGALAGIWTRDLCLTKATLYQAELPRHHNQGFNMNIGSH
jgi:hypothetical protein